MEYLFVEAALFTQAIVKLGLEEELGQLQLELRRNPRAGVLDPGTCGLRKVRIRDSARGQGNALAGGCITRSARASRPST
jgi:hypothetical protein